MGLTLGIALKFYTSVTKGLQLKVRKFEGLILTFVEVTGEKLVGEPFCHPPLPPPHSQPVILNRVNKDLYEYQSGFRKKDTYLFE